MVFRTSFHEDGAGLPIGIQRLKARYENRAFFLLTGSSLKEAASVGVYKTPTHKVWVPACGFPQALLREIGCWVYFGE